jgi:hypothetical protein
MGERNADEERNRVQALLLNAPRDEKNAGAALNDKQAAPPQRSWLANDTRARLIIEGWRRTAADTAGECALWLALALFLAFIIVMAGACAVQMVHGEVRLVNETRCSIVVSADDGAMYVGENAALKSVGHLTLLTRSVYEDRHGVLADDVRCWLLTTRPMFGAGAADPRNTRRTLHLADPTPPSLLRTMPTQDIAMYAAMALGALSFACVPVAFWLGALGIHDLRNRQAIVRRNALLRLFKVVPETASEELIAVAVTKAAAAIHID